ncbi:MAG: cytidine deaminase [Lachnospiraceae bacterium]|nr:cytidine deaminase [Lachnospiraceae bacterium]
MIEERLIEAAFEGRNNAYAPYSEYRVGAALLTENNEIITGCNVENSSYGLCNCAERTAVFKAVSAGAKRFKAIAVAGGKNCCKEQGDETEDYAYPCGACRQVLREFCSPLEFKVIVARSKTDYKVYTLEQLLPDSFGPDSLV